MFFTPLCWKRSSWGPDLLSASFRLEDLLGHRSLLDRLGWSDPQQWVQHWARRGGSCLAASAWPFPVSEEWQWGVAFPLLTALEQASGQASRQLVGLSGLPGCGKSSLAAWIQRASQELNLSVAVVSLDDYYWPAAEMEQAMAGNPWSVPRALPGSHDLNLIAAGLCHWRQSGHLNAPCFDKSLRGGRGDRSGSQTLQADVLLFEGWFLGACPKATPALDPPLTQDEQLYRSVSCQALQRYQSLWEEFDQLWHLRAPSVSASKRWKEEQEASMQRSRGVRLPDEALDQFVRMIETALPQEALQTIDRADVVIELTEDRVLRELRFN